MQRTVAVVVPLQGRLGESSNEDSRNVDAAVAHVGDMDAQRQSPLVVPLTERLWPSLDKELDHFQRRLVFFVKGGVQREGPGVVTDP